MDRPRTTPPSDPGAQPAITGVAALHGAGLPPPRGFWAEAWARVVRRPGAVLGLAWIGLVATGAVVAPFLASGHPLLLRELGSGGEVARTWSPLWVNLGDVDILLALGGVAALVYLALPIRQGRSTRLVVLILAGLQAGLIVLVSRIVSGHYRGLPQPAGWVNMVAGVIAAAAALPFLALTPLERWAARIGVPLAVSLGAWVVITGAGGPAARPAGTAPSWKDQLFVQRWEPPLQVFGYRDREARGEVRATYTLIPFSPWQRSVQLDLVRPGTTLGEALARRTGTAAGAGPAGSARFLLGTDSMGQDVAAQMLHACRLSISIGLVSTGIAVTIGVTLGALMGFFGGWVDLALFRVVEVFMAIPVLFLLIVAAAVLPRSTYVMMAIIGCVTWTGSARFIRAEFMKLRNQDFVQSAKAVGLPLRSILFKHMLPNGVTPVLVDASFAIAAAILAEATLSFLGLGPADQPSWGRLLSDATNQVGSFVWWLAIFPGVGIFLTVLSYNLIGEALRDAIDPKLRKARV
ncbi:MAG TPA: ABC transporter permease [Phycisphaerales bacterium]|nr:ABC transporter permease [Phycisphaerales bacterium]